MRELRRVARGPVVIVSYDAAVCAGMWLMDYLPEIAALDRRIFPPPATLAAWLGGAVDDRARALARDTPDWKLGSFWAHPERVLDPAARAATSGFARMPPAVVERVVAAVARDLASGAWDARHGHLRAPRGLRRGPAAHRRAPRLACPASGGPSATARTRSSTRRAASCSRAARGRRRSTGWSPRAARPRARSTTASPRSTTCWPRCGCAPCNGRRLACLAALDHPDAVEGAVRAGLAVHDFARAHPADARLLAVHAPARTWRAASPTRRSPPACARRTKRSRPP